MAVGKLRCFVSGLVVAALVVAASVAGAAPAGADVPCEGFSSVGGRCVNTQLMVGGTSYSADWYVPNGRAVGLAVLQPGFTRNCGHLRGTSTEVMEAGLMVLCLNADMTAGNPVLADALGDELASGSVTPPLGRPMPGAIVVGGHSAGGHFASALGASLVANGSTSLRGAVLFDPVAAEGFTANLQAISAGGTRPVLSVAARPSIINLFNNSFGALRDLPNAYVGIQLVWSGYAFGWPYGGSCHTDSEGENGDLIGNVAALCTPNDTQVARLREFGSVWARDLATGTRTAAYWCTDEDVAQTCGSAVRALTGGQLPQAATIQAS
jgi:hypothetical protein